MPTFSTNLLSVTALRNQGCTIVFPPSGTDSYIKLPCGSATTLREENKVHYLDLQPRSASDESAVHVAMTASSTMAWHKRLGHLNFAAMKKMAQARMLPRLSAAQFVPSFCHHCPQGKLTVAQFPQQSMSRALVPLGRVNLQWHLWPALQVAATCDLLLPCLRRRTHWVALGIHNA